MTGRTGPPAWTVRCPWCNAAPGNRCTGQRGRRLAIETHDARIQEWAVHATVNQQTGEPR